MSRLGLAIIVGTSADDVARYYATEAINTVAADTPASTFFAPRIAADSDISFRRSVGTPFWNSSRSESTIGSIELANGDGGLDVLRTKTTRNRTVTIKRGTIGTNVTTWVTVGTAILDRVEYPDEDRCRLILRDKAALLDKPVQDSYYSSSNNPSLDDTTSPELIGTCLNIPVVLEDPANLIYNISNTGTLTVSTVRDQGDVLTVTTQYTASGFNITLLQQPVGVITVDATDGNYLFDDFVETLLVTKLGLSTADVPNANLATLTAIAVHHGRWIYDQSTYLQIMDELMVGYGGWWYFDRLGVLQVGRLEAPTGTSTHTFNSVNTMTDEISVELDRAPGLTNLVLGRKNWRVHNESEIAGSLTSPTYTQTAYDLQQGYRDRKRGAGTLHSTYSHANGPSSATGQAGALRPGRVSTIGQGTLITTNDSAADVQAEASRWVGLYTQQRWFCKFSANVGDAYAIEPGSIVTLTVPRYGFDAGQKMMVVSIDGDFLNDKVDIVGWF